MKKGLAAEDGLALHDILKKEAQVWLCAERR
jgi:hypothetical protein